MDLVCCLLPFLGLTMAHLKDVKSFHRSIALSRSFLPQYSHFQPPTVAP